MANISTLLEKIRTAIYGKEMRGAIHDSIEMVNNDLEVVKENIESRGADDIPYDNTDSGLSATNVQSAIDTIAPLKRSSPPNELTAAEKGRICIVETQSTRDFYICVGSYDYDDETRYRWKQVLLDGILTAQIGEELSIGQYCDITYDNNGLPVMTFSGKSAPGCIKFIDETTTPFITKTMQDYLDEKQDALTFDNVPTANSNNPVKSQGIMNFVNSSLGNVAAYYITKNAVGDAFATKAELNAATVYYSGGALRTPTRNDYCVVLKDESKTISSTGEKPTTRYIYDNGTWSFQYIVNNSGLTYSQWQAVNSGMTEEDKNKLDGIQEGAEVNTVSDVQVDGESVLSGGVANIDLSGKLDYIEGSEASINTYKTIYDNQIYHIVDADIPYYLICSHGKENGITYDYQTKILPNGIYSRKKTYYGERWSDWAVVESKVNDVKVDGVSVVDENRIANFTTPPYISIERLRSYLYRATFDEIPEYVEIDTAVGGGCSSYVSNGKLYRNLDWYYDETPIFNVVCKDFQGMAFLSSITDGNLDKELIGQLPYHVSDGKNDYGIMVSTHVLYNDWNWQGSGDKDIPLTKVPYIILSTIKSLDDFEDDISETLANLKVTQALEDADYLLQFLVTDGTTTYILSPPTSSTGSYVVQEATENPKLTNFRWVSDDEVVRTDLQNRPTGVERWNLMPCPLKDLRFTKAYETSEWLSEFIGLGELPTTKNSTDAELLTIYNTAHTLYSERTRNGETWQTVYSIVYSSKGIEELYVQEDFETNFSSLWESTKNKTQTITEDSTDDQYPTAKAVWDLVGNVETLLEGI